MTTEVFTLAAEALASGRRSVTRLVSLSQAKAIARGLVPYLALNIEAALFDDLGVTIHNLEVVDVTWHAHTGHPAEPLQRVPWQPGTPLPDSTLFATCTVSAPLHGGGYVAPEGPNVTALPQVGGVLTVKQPRSESGVSPSTPGT